MQKDFSNSIISLTKANFKLYPVDLDNKRPLTNHGYKSATSDIEQLRQWFNNTDNHIGVGIRLDTSDLVVIDVDNHDNQQGTADLKELSNQNKKVNTDNCDYIEQTQNGGLHYFFKAPKGLNIKKCNITKHIELQTQQTIISPSNKYETLYGKLENVEKELPNFIIDIINKKEKTNIPIKSNSTRNNYSWTASLIDEIFEGADKGGRNVFLTHLIGKLLYTGASPRNVYQLAFLANENLAEPLSDKEVNTIFNSILKRELSNQ